MHKKSEWILNQHYQCAIRFIEVKNGLNFKTFFSRKLLFPIIYEKFVNASVLKGKYLWRDIMFYVLHVLDSCLLISPKKTVILF